MKSPFAKLRDSADSLEAVLRGSPPKSELPPTLHNSIMRAIAAAHREETTQVFGFTISERFARIRWVPITGFAALALLGSWLAFHHSSAKPPISSAQSFSEISSALARSQELMDSLPAVTVGPLSDELDKANDDLERTAKFLLATLP
jgi:hypothetical protein